MSSKGAGVWSAPDKDGIQTCNLDVGAVSTLRGRRRRKGSQVQLDQLALWPSAWRDLLKEWLRQGGARKKWTKLLSVAGGDRVQDALQIMDALLQVGLVEVEEQRERSRWQPLWVEFLDPERIRELVGLTNRNKMQELRTEQGEVEFQSPAVAPLAESLDELPMERAIRRHEILVALDHWISEGYSGTRRDFALFALGDTKAITSAEWSWIDETLPLESIGITQHTPSIWLRAPVAVNFGKGSLDLRCVPDCIGLTPQTIDNAIQVDGQVECWRILENRTVFERVARQRGSVDGVLWVPGFAPSWWKKGVAKVLRLCPAPALIACDPDPAGIDIALSVGKIWSEEKVSWEPWCMDAEVLSALRKRKPLNAYDTNRLQHLIAQRLPEQLERLACWMLENGEKGEQEGIQF